MGGLSLQYLSHVTMIVTGIVQPLATIPSISKLYFTHTQHASGQSLTTWFIFAVASRLWVSYGLLNRKPAIYVGNIIGFGMSLLMVNGILMNAGWTWEQP
jgi:MtN3 and saliva related transmembrane protein